jgi:hypothetical protein
LIALSSTEAEYIAAHEAILEIVWLRALLGDMGFVQSDPTVLYEDNQSCIQFAEGAGSHQRTKHLDRRLHYNRQALREGIITFVHLGTEKMTADILTKPLPQLIFAGHKKELLSGLR